MRVWAKCMRLLDSALSVLYSIPPNIFCGEVPNDKIIRVLHISLFAVGILKSFDISQSPAGATHIASISTLSNILVELLKVLTGRYFVLAHRVSLIVHKDAW